MRSVGSRRRERERVESGREWEAGESGKRERVGEAARGDGAT